MQGTDTSVPLPVPVPDLSGDGDAPPSPIPIAGGGSAPWANVGRSPWRRGVQLEPQSAARKPQTGRWVLPRVTLSTHGVPVCC
jgi:hypothetical protein